MNACMACECRNLVSCLGMVELDQDHPGLPKGYTCPVWGMVLELCRVSWLVNWFDDRDDERDAEARVHASACEPIDGCDDAGRL